MERLQRSAWILILDRRCGIPRVGRDGGCMAPDHLLGPGGKPILPAGYEGFSGGSWSELAGTSPMTAGYMTVLFRMYGIYNVAVRADGESPSLPRPSAVAIAGHGGRCWSATRSHWCRR